MYRRGTCSPPLPRPNAGEEEAHLFEPPTKLLTSEQIRARFSEAGHPEEKHGKTIDEIILENVKGFLNKDVNTNF